MRLGGDSAASGIWRRPALAVALALIIAAAALTTASGASVTPSGCAQVTIAQENAKPGGLGWIPPPAPATPAVQGYASATSAVCGQRVTLYLGTHARHPVPVRVAAWRLGYYRGAGGRLVWTSGTVRVARPKVWDTVAPVTDMVSAPWRPSLSFVVPHTWSQGVYELRIDPLQKGLHPGTIPLVVRDGARTTRLVEVLSTNTWQMYNTWGGLDAYTTPRASRVVSLNRPFDGYGMVSLVTDDYPIVRFVEAHGLDVSYVTDPDLDRGVTAVADARALVFGSHTEYWTTGMRADLRSRLPVAQTRCSSVPTTCTGGPSRSGRRGPTASWPFGRCRRSIRTRAIPHWRRSSGAIRRSASPSRRFSARNSGARTCSSR